MKEEFDRSWHVGPGMYFAEQANYSINYSYRIKQQDDPVHANKNVLLCCRVATGKIIFEKPNDGLRRPPKEYDCVIGFTNESNIFVLYGMDVRRAYPEYEIIFE